MNIYSVQLQLELYFDIPKWWHIEIHLCLLELTQLLENVIIFPKKHIADIVTLCYTKLDLHKRLLHLVSSAISAQQHSSVPTITVSIHLGWDNGNLSNSRILQADFRGDCIEFKSMQNWAVRSGREARISLAQQKVGQLSPWLRDLQGKPEAELAGAARDGGAKCANSVRPLIGLNFAGKLFCVEPCDTSPAALKTLQLEGAHSQQCQK